MKNLKRHITDTVPIAPLASFRVLFGFIMVVSIIRFIARGWIDQLYIEPEFFFVYQGFEWIRPFSPAGMYTIFTIMGLSALGILLGWRYRLSSILFFLSFTYVELIDKTNYLNHYYFVSIVAFLLMLVPAGRYFSLDVYFNPKMRSTTVPAWTVNAIKLQLGLVYFFAGIAKINTDWLLKAMPLKIWLAGKTNIPVIGWLFNYSWVPFVFSWFGMLYDVLVPFLLVMKRTRPFAYIAVVVFHLMTAALFNIGMFPYIMILSTLIFFPAVYHQKAIDTVSHFLEHVFGGGKRVSESRATVSPLKGPIGQTLIIAVLGIHFAFQLAMPLRHMIYPGDLFWTEEGYRFSWRVMLMEKAGFAEFNVIDPLTGMSEMVRNEEYLTPYQEKMMSTQPDMILQYAHHLAHVYRAKGYIDPQVSVDSYVTLNGRRSQPLIRHGADLARIEVGEDYASWVTNLGKND